MRNVVLSTDDGVVVRVKTSGMMAGCEHHDACARLIASLGSAPLRPWWAFGDPNARDIRLQRRGNKRRLEPAASSTAHGPTERFAGFATGPVGAGESTESWRSAASTVGGAVL